MDTTAQTEVLNWITNIPADKLKYADGTWRVDTSGSAVDAVYSYNFVTVDLDSFNKMDKDDRIKKSRKWLKSSSNKKVKVACQFDEENGTPLIYHLDY